MNQLKSENSAYLKQHEDNPVHWHPYNGDAINLAKEKDMPIFLSIGYSSCHWCHVMAHESFEDETTAKFLNENFVNIKVDREEFPDIDQMYQKAAMFFGRNGGWPLSVFLTPEMKPFFIGTYFPKAPRGQSPSFMNVLEELTSVYKTDRKLVNGNADNAMEFMRNPDPGEKPERIELQGHFPHPNSIFDALKEYKDDTFGGYGKAPKFPMFAFWEWSYEQMAEGIVEKSHGDFVVKTTDSILFGGLYDHARGGIHRYSTDERYQIPHFEKMLYDQAGLLKFLSKASLIYPAPHVLDAIGQTLQYLRAEMQSDSGYFFSAQDADSEGQEGLYFTFTRDEIEELIDENEKLKSHKEKLLQWCPFPASGNFENGLSVLSLDPQFKDEFLQQENWELIRELRKIVLEERKTRIPPMTDNKGVASWNFFLASALVDVVQFVRIPSIKDSAKNLLESALKGIHEGFVLDASNDSLSKIRHTTTKESSLPYLEDYAFFADMQLRLFEFIGEETFKNNFKTTLGFIFKEFYRDNQFLSRAISHEESYAHPNLPIEKFDLSFRSPFSTVVELVRRYTVLFTDMSYLSKMDATLDDLKQKALRNPLNHAQAIRALCYPDNAYRVLKAPKSWMGKGDWLNLWCQLLGRFTINFEESRNSNEAWEICSYSACELQGEGLNHLIETLRGPQNSQQSPPPGN